MSIKMQQIRAHVSDALHGYEQSQQFIFYPWNLNTLNTWLAAAYFTRGILSFVQCMQLATFPQ